MVGARHQLLAFFGLCIGLVVGPCAAFFLGGPTLAIIIAGALLVLAALVNRMFVVRTPGLIRVQLMSLSIVAAASASFFVPTKVLEDIILPLLSVGFEVVGLQPPESPQPWFAGLILGAVLATVVILNWLWFRRQVTVPPPIQAETEPFPTQDFLASLRRYCTALVRDLDHYDAEVNWSDAELTPLEAEIETDRRNSLRPRIVRDLVEAIRRDRTTELFLLIGDPGSGKSVSLRRLCRVLCHQAPRSGVVPVYVNLREFTSAKEPTTQDIVDFVKVSTEQRTGRDGRALLETWYEPLRKTGRLFFIIDSFDELPAVLDCDDKSESHRRVSKAFDRFFSQEVQSCRGVLASRQFRAPVDIKAARLIVQPFRETQIRNAMRTWLRGRGIDVDHFVRSLFYQRPELVPLIRNPFTAELLAQFAMHHPQDPLPPNMFAVFDDYIRRRLESDAPAIRQHGVEPVEALEAATLVAQKMYQVEGIGLEVDLDHLRSFLHTWPRAEAEGAIEALRYARIARFGGIDRRRFSFVHRRFAEFFMVRAMQASSQIPDLAAIPTDSRQRDGLVVYCGVASEDECQRIAEFCWGIIRKGLADLQAEVTDEGRHAIHCLRFLSDAFRSDHRALSGFQQELSELIINLLRGEDLLVAKIAAEALPLVTPGRRSEAVKAAFQTGSAWVCKTALGACRHLADIGEDAQRVLRQYIQSLPTLELIASFRDLTFSLSLSDSLRVQKQALYLDVIQMAVLVPWFLVTMNLLASKHPTRYIVIAILLLFFYAGFELIEHRARAWFDFIQWRHIPARDGIEAVLRYGPLYAMWGMSMTLSSRWSVEPTPWLIPMFIGIGLPIWVPWESWRSLVRALRTPRELRRAALLLIRSVLLVLLFFAPFGVVLYLFSHLLEPYKNLISTWLTIMVALGGGSILVRANIRLLPAVWNRWHDKRHLRILGCPEHVTRALVFQHCQELRTSYGRVCYLEMLRMNRVPIEGPVSPTPSILTEDPRVREELARLEEQWQQLAN